jgi:acyl carrier protein
MIGLGHASLAFETEKKDWRGHDAHRRAYTNADRDEAYAAICDEIAPPAWPLDGTTVAGTRLIPVKNCSIDGAQTQERPMPAEEIRERVESTIVDVLKVDAAELGSEQRIREDLGADSLDSGTLVLAVEDEFGGSINDNDAKSLATVGDVITYINRRVEEKALA